MSLIENQSATGKNDLLDSGAAPFVCDRDNVTSCKLLGYLRFGEKHFFVFKT